MKMVSIFLGLLALILPISPVSAQISPLEGIAAVTSPSADVTLSFVQPGRIAEVLIKEGENVKASMSTSFTYTPRPSLSYDTPCSPSKSR